MRDNSNKNIKRKKRKNVITNAAGLDLNNRYCRVCSVKLVPSRTGEKGVYMCPTCNCVMALRNTKPQEKLVTTFSFFDPNTSPEKKLVLQNSEERLSRSQYFIRKQREHKNHEEEINNDPFLKALLNNSQIKVTNYERYSYDDNDYYYDSH